MKLNPISIYIIGFAVALMAISYGVFYNLMPNNKQAEYFRESTELLNTEAGKMGRAKKKVEDAEKDIQAVADRWKAIAAVHTPPGNLAQGGINVGVNGYQLTEDARKFRNSVQREVNAQVRKGGITVVNGPLVPAAEGTEPGQILANYFNYASAGYPVVIYNFGTVTVQGTYEKIMAHLRAYKAMPRYLAVTDGLTLDGTSPNLTANYNLTVVGFIPASTVYGGAPGGGVAAPNAAPGPGGMPGGMPTGMPGIPGGAGRPGGAGAPGGPPPMPNKPMLNPSAG